ncbi:MAG: glutaredoxin family protein [Halioglobus sp.]
MNLTESYILYGTTACHLCELAELLLLSLDEGGNCPPFVKVDIAESDELFERYGVRIPVLRNPDGSELNWPFTAQELSLFLGE